MAQIAAAASASNAKSRSETLSSELAVGRSKPSALAVASRSIGKEVPASAAAPSGHSFIPFAGVGEARPVAAQHLDIGQQMMAEGHPAGALCIWVKPGITAVGMLKRPCREGLLQLGDLLNQLVQRVAHPEPKIDRDPGRCASAPYAAVPPPGPSLVAKRDSTFK